LCVESAHTYVETIEMQVAEDHGTADGPHDMAYVYGEDSPEYAAAQRVDELARSLPSLHGEELEAAREQIDAEIEDACSAAR
jgi:hypothetical protein